MKTWDSLKVSEKYLIQMGIRLPKNQKFSVSKSGNSIFVLNNRTGFYVQHHINEFIKHTGLYNEKTEKYPFYVHMLVYILTK